MGYLTRKKRDGRPYGSWHAHWKDDAGVWRKRCTGTRTRKLALQKLAQWEAGEHFPGGMVEVLKWKDFVGDYERWASANKQASTCRGERPILARLGRVFGDERLDRIDTVAVQRYVERRRKDGVKAATINRELSCLRSVLTLAVARRNAVRVPEIPRLRESDSERRSPIPGGTIQDVLDHLDARARLAVLVLYHTGMRRGEVCSITWGQVDLRERVIRLSAANTKAGRPRDVYINDELAEYLEAADRERPIFAHHPDTLVDWLKRAMIAAGVYEPGSVCHSLRHLFASDMIHAGVDMNTVKDLGGWSSLDMVARYAHSSEDRQRRAVANRTSKPGNVIPFKASGDDE